GLRTQGPTPSTYYSISTQDGRNRLTTLRSIPVGNSVDDWKLELGYAVDEYRSPWVRSLQLNMLGMVTEISLLLAGAVMLRREKRLNKQIEAWSSFVSTVVTHIPTPLAIVQVGTAKIILANDALTDMFGARVQIGERFSTLFAEPASWTDINRKDSGEPIAML